MAEDQVTDADRARLREHFASVHYVGDTFAEYPLNGSQLARLLTRSPVLGIEYSREDYIFIQHRVRDALRRLSCPKRGDSTRSAWVVDEDMAKRVARELELPWPP